MVYSITDNQIQASHGVLHRPLAGYLQSSWIGAVLILNMALGSAGAQSASAPLPVASPTAKPQQAEDRSTSLPQSPASDSPAFRRSQLPPVVAANRSAESTIESRLQPFFVPPTSQTLESAQSSAVDDRPSSNLVSPGSVSRNRVAPHWLENQHFAGAAENRDLQSEQLSATTRRSRLVAFPASAAKTLVPSFQQTQPQQDEVIRRFNESLRNNTVQGLTQQGAFREVGRAGFLPSQGNALNLSPTPLDLDSFPVSGRSSNSTESAGAANPPADPTAPKSNVEPQREALPPAMSSSPTAAQGNEAERFDWASRREQIVENYPDGKPRIYRSVVMDPVSKDYFDDGPWRVVDRTGITIAKGEYRKGVMFGEWRRRHVASEGGLFATKPFPAYQGPFVSTAFFQNGKLNGQWIVFDRTQTSIFEISYKNGVRHGPAAWYYPDRTKMREANFKEGVLDGEVIERDEDNKIVSRQRYIDGRKVVRNTSMYRPGLKRSEEYFLDVRLVPEGLDNWWAAKPTPFVANGVRVQSGPVSGWYANQQLRYRGRYKDDRPIGQFFWWHENGNRKTMGRYNERGERAGRWIWWHANGRKQVDGEYDGDQPIGIWRSWSDDGRLLKERNYDQEAKTSILGGDDANSGEAAEIERIDLIDPVNPNPATPEETTETPQTNNAKPAAASGDEGAASEDPAENTGELPIPIEGANQAKPDVPKSDTSPAPIEPVVDDPAATPSPGTSGTPANQTADSPPGNAGGASGAGTTTPTPNGIEGIELLGPGVVGESDKNVAG